MIPAFCDSMGHHQATWGVAPSALPRTLMQSNRPLVLLLLVALIVGGVVAWQMTTAGAPPIAPNPDAADRQQSAEPAGAAPVEGDVGPESAAADGEQRLREAVVTDPSKSDRPSIVGQVVDASGRPVADAEVAGVPGSVFSRDFRNFDFADLDIGDTNLFDPNDVMGRIRQQRDEMVTVRTDEQGRFRVRVEGTSRKVSLRVLARGHLVFGRAVERPEQQDVDVGVLQLETGAIVAGRVLDAAGNPVVGAYVARTLPFEDGLPDGMDFSFPGIEAMRDLPTGEGVRTDERGFFELAHMEAGDFSLRARHDEYPTATRKDLTVGAGRTLANVTMTMARGATIRGTVVGVPDGVNGLQVMAAARPKAGGFDPTGGLMGMIGDASELLDDMGMSFSERQCDIAADGSFELRGLKAGSRYRVWLGQQGLGFTGGGVSSERVEAAADAVDVVLRYDPGVTVTFVVVDDATGEPVERMWVQDQLRGGGGLGDLMAAARPGNARQQTYPEGRVTVADLRPKEKQKLHVTIQAVGYDELKREEIELPAGGAGNVDLGTLRLTPTPVLNVTVLAAETGRPLSGARVRVELDEDRGDDAGAAMMRRFGVGGGAGPDSGRTDSSGKCALNAVEGAQSRLDVTRRGFAPQRVVVPPVDGGATEQVVRMLVGGAAEVLVRGPDEQPMAGIDVDHRTPLGDSDRRKTDEQGVARFEHLTPGEHEFRIAAIGGGMFAAEFARATGRDQAMEPWLAVEIADGEAANVTLTKSPTARLTGVVRENGMPLAGARVSFREGQQGAGDGDVATNMMESVMGRMGQASTRTAKTGDDGVFELSELPSGAHSLRVTHRDRAMASTVLVTLRDGDNRFDVDLEMTTLRGVVRDPEGNPVAGAKVTVARKSANGEGARVGRMVSGMMPGMGFGGSSQTTADDGSFELRGVAADAALEVHATAKGLAPATVEATVALGEARDGVDVQLGAAGRIEVTVAEKAMFAAVQATYVTETDERVDPVMQLMRRGKGVLQGLRPGTWEVTYQGMNRGEGEPPKRTVEVVAGQTATVDF